jgi:Cys-tRNA(Pro) deacylase
MAKFDLPEGASRVQEFLLSQGTGLIVELLPESTATAQDAAATLGVELSQIGKSIVFGNENQVIVTIICGDQKVDSELLTSKLKTSNITLLKANIVKEKTGFVIGGVCPFALPKYIEILIDERLYKQSTIYVAAGHPKAVVRVSGDDLVKLTGGTICSLTLNIVNA